MKVFLGAAVSVMIPRAMEESEESRDWGRKRSRGIVVVVWLVQFVIAEACVYTSGLGVCCSAAALFTIPYSIQKSDKPLSKSAINSI